MESYAVVGGGLAGLTAAKSSDLLGGFVADNVAIARDILAGKKGPKRDIVVLNAAIALVAAGQAKMPKEGAEKAADALDSGAARRKLEQLAAASR